MDRFIGNMDAKTDAKGRVFVPSTFRKIFQSAGETRLILKKDVYQDCLILYPENVWHQELQEMRKNMDKWDPDQQMVYRIFQMNMEILELDSNGRILIPKRYLQLAEISSEVRFVGMDDTIEIWAKHKLEQPLMDPETYKENIRKWMTKKPVSQEPLT